MSSNIVFFAWDRPIPGREHLSATHFEEFMAYLGGLKEQGIIESFDPVLLNAHGGDMNGFFMIRGESAKLDAMMSSQEWINHMTRGILHLEGSGAIRGVTGKSLMERMDLWRKSIPA